MRENHETSSALRPVAAGNHLPSPAMGIFSMMKFLSRATGILAAGILFAGQIPTGFAEEVEPNAAELEALPDLSDLSVEELVVKLGDEEFQVREAAQARLIELNHEVPEEVGAAVFEAFEESRDPEVRMRARGVLIEHALQHAGYHGGRGFIGITFFGHNYFTPDGELNFGIKVGNVMGNFPGEEGGLVADDLILAVDDVSLNDPRGDALFSDYVSGRPPGSKITLLVQRGLDAPKEIEITLTERPEEFDENLVEAEPEDIFQRWLEDRRAAALAEDAEDGEETEGDGTADESEEVE